MSKTVEFTTEEEEILSLGWHEALLMSMIENFPGDKNRVRFLDILTRHPRGLAQDKNIIESVKVLEECLEFFNTKYKSDPDPEGDSTKLLDDLYTDQLRSDTICRRIKRAIEVFKSKKSK